MVLRVRGYVNVLLGLNVKRYSTPPPCARLGIQFIWFGTGMGEERVG